MTQDYMTKSRIKIYIDDLFHRGLGYFIFSRLQKYRLTRRFIAIFKKNYVPIWGYKLYINPMDTVVSATLAKTGTWEPFVSKQFIQIAKKARTIVDVGGNIGYFTLLGAACSKSSSNIFVFEPDVVNFQSLTKTVKENKLENVTCEKVAIAQNSGKISLFISPDNLGDHRTFDSGDNRETEVVRVVSLDDYFNEYPHEIDLLKIDIQGYEHFAIMGAKKLFQKKRIKVILSELWPYGLQIAGCNWRNYLKLLEQSGFSLWEVNEEEQLIRRLNKRKIADKILVEAEYSTTVLAVLNV